MAQEDTPKLWMGGSVRYHPVWRNEYKPYAWANWPYKALHSSGELHYLYRTPLCLGKGNYANLGVYHGASTHALAHGAAVHGGHVFGVDIFERTKSTPRVVRKEALDAEFQKRGLERFVTLHEGSTNECADRLSDYRFKFIFIDADHSYEAVLEDIQRWCPLLEPDGLLSLHDTFKVDIDRAITEELGGWELVDHVYTIKTFRRKNAPDKDQEP